MGFLPQFNSLYCAHKFMRFGTFLEFWPTWCVCVQEKLDVMGQNGYDFWNQREKLCQKHVPIAQ